MRTKEIRAKRANLFEQMKGIMDGADAEKRSMSADERSAYAGLDAEFETLTGDLKIAMDLETRERELGNIAAEEAEQRDRVASTRGAKPVAVTDTPEYRDAFMEMVRYGTGSMETDTRRLLAAGRTNESRDLSKATNAAGGFLVPQDFVKRLYLILQENMIIRQIGATILTTGNGEDLPYPFVSAYATDDTTQAPLTAETVAVSFVDDTFSQITLKAYTYATGARVSIQLLEDNVVDLEGFLAARLGTRVSRNQDIHFTTGTGTNQPKGLVTATTTGITGAVGQTLSVTGDNLIDLQHKIATPYRKNAKWLMNDATLAVIRKIKDANGNYMYQTSLRDGQPDTLLGKALWTDTNVAVMAANAKSILFGDFSAYLIRDVHGVTLRRLEERYADQLEVGFIAWLRSDANLIDANAVTLYRNSAT